MIFSGALYPMVGLILFSGLAGAAFAQDESNVVLQDKGICVPKSGSFSRFRYLIDMRSDSGYVEFNPLKPSGFPDHIIKFPGAEIMFIEAPPREDGTSHKEDKVAFVSGESEDPNGKYSMSGFIRITGTQPGKLFLTLKRDGNKPDLEVECDRLLNTGVGKGD